MLVLLSGVSGAGKDTIKKELIRRNERIVSLPSYTDRAPREGEVNGEIYNFITTEEFEELIKNNDLYSIGKASTFSSLANESIHKKEGLEQILETPKNYGAYGVNVAHSGTVVGILIDKSMNDTRLIELLKNERLDSVYKKMYTSNIIDGGIRGEQTWNTSKIL